MLYETYIFGVRYLPKTKDVFVSDESESTTEPDSKPIVLSPKVCLISFVRLHPIFVDSAAASKSCAWPPDAWPLGVLNKR